MRRRFLGVWSATVIGLLVLLAGAWAAFAVTPPSGTNLAFNPAAAGFPHPLESAPGYNHWPDPLWHMVDGVISPGTAYWEGVAFNDWVEENNLTVDFGETMTFHEMRVWSESTLVGQATVEYWDGAGWTEITTGAWTHEQIWRRFDDQRLTNSSTADWSPVWTPEFNWSEDVDIVSLPPVSGSKLRVRTGPVGWFWLAEIEVYGSAVMAVPIDIKPGSFPNSINPRSQGVIPVAILTTPEFDAAEVEASTCHFGLAGAEAVARHWALEDVDADGDIDMILQFPTPSSGLGCGVTSATLTGNTVTGQSIQGVDSVQIVGCS